MTAKEEIRTAPKVPQELATPTDLEPEAVRKMTEVLNGLVADAFALFVKCKNFHWHVAGPHFRDYHLLFDEHAEQILGSIDILAERVRRIGGTTIRSIGHIGEFQTIPDNEADFIPAVEMIKNLLADNLHMAERQREAMELAEEQRDHPTGNLLQEMLDATEKRIWFLHEASIGD
jgi:starvation-inducible DNA-binding protein